MKRIFVTTLLCIVAATSWSQDEWKLRKNEDGIKIFTKTPCGSNFKGVRVECVVNARLSQIIAMLLDVDKQRDWIYNIKSSRVVRKVAANELVYYSEVAVPWPFTNRDYVTHFSIKQVSPSLTVLDSKAEPWAVTEYKNLVRVKTSSSHWEITSLGQQQQRIVYTAQYDPAGSVPAWLTNMFVVKGPFQTFQKLRSGVVSPAYRQAHFDFIRE